MKRRTLDIMFSVGGVLLAVLLLVLGLVLRSNANFAKSYVHDQLTSQQITFAPVSQLTPAEQKSSGLVDNAGQLLTTGKQAEIYANDYIADHLSQVNGGKTYSQTSTDARALQAQATAAQQSNAPNAADLTQQATALQAKVQTLFQGETLRGLLLTSYGFSIFGDKAMMASWVCFAASLVLFLASAAGFVHAFRTSKEEAFAPIESTTGHPVAMA
jgi:hypothetical protein